jgi:hypothetical protein
VSVEADSTRTEMKIGNCASRGPAESPDPRFRCLTLLKRSARSTNNHGLARRGRWTRLSPEKRNVSAAEEILAESLRLIRQPQIAVPGGGR